MPAAPYTAVADAARLITAIQALDVAPPDSSVPYSRRAKR
jgi:hypothetical protein